MEKRVSNLAVPWRTYSHEPFVSPLRLAASYFRDMAPSGMVRPRLRSTPLSPNSRLLCKRARSTFFGSSVRVDDLHYLALALALDDASLAPATIPLPVEARLLESLPDGMGAYLGQTIGSLP